MGAWELPYFLDDWVYAEVRDAIAEAASGVATGQVSAEVAMREVQRVAQRVTAALEGCRGRPTRSWRKAGWANDGAAGAGAAPGRRSAAA